MLAAVRAGRVTRVWLAEGARTKIIEDLRAAAQAGGVEIETVPRARLDSWSETGAHQGVMADATAREDGDWRGAVERARAAGIAPLIVALDGIQDPHNLGAIVRSAAAFGAHAVVIPGHRAASITPVVTKAAAGAMEVIPVQTLASLQPALEDARGLGLWIIALAEQGAEPLDACPLLREPCVVVIGGEGRGVSRTLRNLADATVSIPTAPGFPTLNASVAAGITLHAASRTSRP